MAKEKVQPQQAALQIGRSAMSITQDVPDGGDHQKVLAETGKPITRPMTRSTSAGREGARHHDLDAHVEYETTARHYAHVDCPGMPTM